MRNESRQEAIKVVLTSALEHNPAERECFVHASVDDPDIRAEVIELLEAFEDAGDFMSDPGAGVQHELSCQSDGDLGKEEAVGSIIARYELVELIGEGGFGLVYRAKQREPVVRDVALKIIKVGMDTRQVMARFEVERQALAVMEHPNIARVIDAGATMSGRPYFVMELVDGVPITTYCDQHRLALNARLELFSNVCEAVHHAHTKGVIHRDIKPSNVLVARGDRQPIPKVIDFGIAKATGGDNAVDAFEQPRPAGVGFTIDGTLIGTPAYMSPEQAAPAASGSRDIDTRTDVYSLGVLVYELLTGVTPFDEARLRSSSLAEIQRTLREDAPPPPSTRFSRLESSATLAEQRAANPRRLTKNLQGDLDWIALKALDKDRERRYRSAAELADDVRRHLTHHPVMASSSGALYRCGKFVRRNRMGVIAAAGVALALVGGTIGTSIGMMRARDAALAAASVNSFMNEVLTSANPDKSGADVRLVEVLDAASESTPQRFARQPELEAEVHAMLGRVYGRLSVRKESEKEYRKAVALWQSCAGPDDPRTLDAILGLAESLVNQQRGRDAEACLGDIIPQLDRAFGPDHPRSIEGRGIVANMLKVRGRLDESEHLLRESLRRAAELGIKESIQLRLLNSLTGVLRNKIGVDESPERDAAIERFRASALQQFDRGRRLPGEGALFTFAAREHLAAVAMDIGDYPEAAAQARALLEESRDRLADCDAIRRDAMKVLADAVNRMGGLPSESADLYAQLIDCMRAAENLSSIYRVTRLASALVYFDRASRWSDGEMCAREVIEVLKEIGSAHVGSYEYEDYLAHFVSHQGRLDEAETMFHTLLARENEISDECERARLLIHYAGHLARRGLFEDAEQGLIRAAHIVGEIRQGTAPEYPDDILVEFIALYTAWGKREEAAKYEALRAESLEWATHAR